MSAIRTRFAPSPTGYLHIGGVRTALFNWLFARRHGGQFILRIDDTDRQRNVEEALAPILHGFRWLGLDWDEGPEVGGGAGPYYQSEKRRRYQQAVDVLLQKGLAYRDFARPEELQQEREEARRSGRRFTYSRNWRAADDAAAARFEGEGRSGVVRLMMPREGECRFTDLVRGEVAFAWDGEQDHVIQRADGSCLYHLASAVDDEDMGISHVIRAEEHLSNTPRQIFIAQGLGFQPPAFAHLPAVAEPGSRTKLSKRKLDKYMKNAEFAQLNARGAAIARATGLQTEAETFNPVIVDFYERTGFLPHAVLNYLLLLGWSLDDRTEFFGRDDMIRNFSLERVNKAPASFDPVKLLAFQGHYMHDQDTETRARQVLPFLQRAGLVGRPATDDEETTIRRVTEAAGERLVLAGDVLDYAAFFQEDGEFPVNMPAVHKRLVKPDGALDLLQAFGHALDDVEPWQPERLEEALRTFVDRRGVKVGALIHGLRLAVTGQPVGFGLYDAMAILGRESCLARIERVLGMARKERA